MWRRHKRAGTPSSRGSAKATLPKRKGTLGQGRRDCRTQQAAQGTSGRKGAVARAAQAGNRETAGRLSKRDRGSHPQGGSCRAVVKGERYRHRKATETDRLA